MESILQVFQQRKLISIILGISGIANFQDDFLVPLPKHDKRLRKVFSKIKEKGLKLKKTKCQIRLYYGDTLFCQMLKLILRKLK